MPTKHTKVLGTAVADDGNPNTVSPADWDDDHIGKLSSSIVDLVHPLQATAPATNLAAGAFLAVSDPSTRAILDLRGLDSMRVFLRLGGSIVAATKIRLQYHLTNSMGTGISDAGWTTLYTTAGSHVLNTFIDNTFAIPIAARVENCVVRVGILDGDGVADPTITCCRLRFI